MKRRSHKKIQELAPGRGKSKYKGPGVGMSLMCSRVKESQVARVGSPREGDRR